MARLLAVLRVFSRRQRRGTGSQSSNGMDRCDREGDAFFCHDNCRASVGTWKSRCVRARRYACAREEGRRTGSFHAVKIEMAKPLYPSFYQINTRVWLTELSRNSARKATLDDIP